MPAAPVYKAEDRSVLLPYYKRFLLEPLLPHIPASVNPNTITYLGLVLMLLATALLWGLRPSRGWPLLAAAALIQAYVWCDNADGSHARRTKQTSAFGEFLDHGLDILNIVCLGLLTVSAIAPTELQSVLTIWTIPAASAVTCWEQTETGIFHLGFLNQIESCLVLCTLLVVDSVMGVGFLAKYGMGGFTLRDFFVWWPAFTITFGIVRGIVRVAKAGKAVTPVMVFLGAQGLVLAGFALGAFSLLAAFALLLSSNVFFGIRQLVQRIEGTPSRTEPALALLGVIGIGAIGAVNVVGPLPSDKVLLGSAVISALYLVAAVRETARGVRALRLVE